MKKCKYCGNLTENKNNFCPSCSANEFYNVCSNCGQVFEGGMFCMNCGTKVGVEPKVCPNCKNTYTTNACPQCGYMPEKAPAQPTQPTTQQPETAQTKPESPKKQSKSSALLGLLALGLIVFAIVSLISDGLVSFFTDDDNKKSVTITMDEYEEIEVGMSYDDVVEIVGGKGELKNENGKGTDFHTEMYRYEGKDKRSYASLYFINGTLRTKSQLGLDD